MQLSLEEVTHIALLARLSLTQEEAERYRSQLSDILAYAQRLQAVNIEAVPPMERVLAESGRMREDIPTPGLSHEDLFKNAAQVKDDQFKIPPVLG